MARGCLSLLGAAFVLLLLLDPTSAAHLVVLAARSVLTFAAALLHTAPNSPATPAR